MWSWTTTLCLYKTRSILSQNARLMQNKSNFTKKREMTASRMIKNLTFSWYSGQGSSATFFSYGMQWTFAQSVLQNEDTITITNFRTCLILYPLPRPVAGVGVQGVWCTPNLGSTFSHKMGKKWDVCKRVKGGGEVQVTNTYNMPPN